MEGDLRGFRVAVCADALVNPEPGGLDALVVCERAGFGVMQLPATWYPDDVAAGWLVQVAEQLDEYLRRGYAVVLLTSAAIPRARHSARRSAAALAAIGHALPTEFASDGDVGRAGVVPARPARARRRGVSSELAVRGGLVVAPGGAREADVLDRGRADRRDRREPGEGGRRGDRRARLRRAPRRGRRARPRRARLPPHGRRLGDLGRPLRRRLARGGRRRHDDDHRLRDAGRGRGPAGAARAAADDIRDERRGRRAALLDARGQPRGARRAPELVARGVPSLKVFLAYSQLGEPMEEEDLLAVWKAVAAAGGIMQAHCESWPIIRPRLEAAMAERRDGLCRLRRLAPARLRGRRGRPRARVRRRQRRRDLLRPPLDARRGRASAPRAHARARRARRVLPAPPAAGRVALSRRAPGDFVMSPPLRTAEHRAALWAGLVDGTLEVVAADHAAWPAPIKAPGPGFLEAVHGAAGQRPAAAADGGAGRAGRRLRLGARRASDAPRTRRASSGCPTRARSRRASTPTSSSCTRRRAARAAGAALLAGRQRHLPRPPARAPAPRRAARPHARARRGVHRRARQRAGLCPEDCNERGACETTQGTRIGGLEC